MKRAEREKERVIARVVGKGRGDRDAVVLVNTGAEKLAVGCRCNSVRNSRSSAPLLFMMFACEGCLQRSCLPALRGVCTCLEDVSFRYLRKCLVLVDIALIDMGGR